MNNLNKGYREAKYLKEWAEEIEGKFSIKLNDISENKAVFWLTWKYEKPHDLDIKKDIKYVVWNNKGEVVGEWSNSRSLREDYVKYFKDWKGR